MSSTVRNFFINFRILINEVKFEKMFITGQFKRFAPLIRFRNLSQGVELRSIILLL